MSLPQRKYPRLCLHDYNGGTYFVTGCTSEKRHYFGEIYNNEINLSLLGKELCDNLENITQFYRNVEIPLFQVMPNHFHAIVVIDSPLSTVGSRPVATEGKLHYNSRLSVVIGCIKSHITRFAKKNNIDFAWQSRFYDHIIRNNLDGNNIANYILTNVQRWDSDCYNIKQD